MGAAGSFHTAAVAFLMRELPGGPCSAPDMKALGVRTILDLRRLDRPCKKKGSFVDTARLVGRYAMKVRATIVYFIIYLSIIHDVVT